MICSPEHHFFGIDLVKVEDIHANMDWQGLVYLDTVHSLFWRQTAVVITFEIKET